MTMWIQCDKCNEYLSEQGGLAFSPPNWYDATVKKEPPYWNHKWAIAQDIDWYKNPYKEKK